MSDQNQHIRTLFESVNAYIASAEEKMSEGRYVELGELGPMVDDLCQQVLTLPRPIDAAFSDALDETFLALTRLRDGIEVAKKRLGNEAKSLQKRQKALKLYSNSAPNNTEH